MMQAEELKALIKDLTHAGPSERRAAAEALSAADERAIYPLIRALQDEHPGVQDAAMRSLITLGGEVTAYMVLPLLREGPFLRNTSMLILKEIGAAAVPLLRPLLADKDDDIRKFAVDLVSEIKWCDYPREIARLVEADPNANVRASAARAVGILGYRDALPLLLAALKDEEWVCFSALESLALLKDESCVDVIGAFLAAASAATRYAAIEALGKIGSPRASGMLIEYLPKAVGLEKTALVKSLVQIGVTPDMDGVSDALLEMLVQGDWDERLIALSGLVQLREERAIPSIIDVAGSLDPSDPASDERLPAVESALRSFGCAKALIDMLDAPSIKYRGRVIVVEAIGSLRCEAAVPHLIKLLSGNLRDVRRASMRALAELSGNADARRALIQAVNDYDGHVRKAAVGALGRVGEKSAFEPLMKLLGEERYDDVAEEIVKALLRLDPPAFFSQLAGLQSSIREKVSRFSADPAVLLALSRDDDLKVRVSAFYTLGGIGDDRARARLKEALHDDAAEVRKAAVMALGKQQCCYDDIRTALQDPDMWVRLYAVKALGNVLRPDTIGAVVPLLEDNEVAVVLSAIDAVAQVGGKEALMALRPLRNHHDAAVRERALQLMESLC